MAANNLVFYSAADTSLPANLVFGANEAPPIPDPLYLNSSGRMSGLRIRIGSQFSLNVSRPLVSQVGAAYQEAGKTQSGTECVYQQGLLVSGGHEAVYQDALKTANSLSAVYEQADRLSNWATLRVQEATRLQTTPLVGCYEEADRLRNGVGAAYQQAIKTSAAGTRTPFQESYRRRSTAQSRYEEAVKQQNGLLTDAGYAAPFSKSLDARYEEAWKPRNGIWIKPPIPGPDPCYFPTLPANLIFEQTFDNSLPAQLIFVCGKTPLPPAATVLVPVRRVYMILNEASLTRVDGSVPIPTYSMSMSLDVDSWTWRFSASVPGAELANLEPSVYGEPVEVQAMVNGVAYRFIVEQITRDRKFADSRLSLSGRGKAALLDSPYSAEMSFGNIAPRTANQLMEDVLTLNGVSLGWAVQWQIEDWNVPANVFSHNGSYMAALNTIAAAPGAYIQPHRTDKTLYVKPRFIDMPHKWSSLTPDIELPSAGVTQEGIEWRNLPDYNRVFVSGTSNGIVGQVTRAGTAGDYVAPMVSDALITDATVARQRGLVELSNTGRQVPISLRMPIFAETGVIEPGKLVRYTDNGVNRVGMSRSVSVDVGKPDIWQTVVLETYE